MLRRRMGDLALQRKPLRVPLGKACVIYPGFSEGLVRSCGDALGLVIDERRPTWASPRLAETAP
jgi:hypothetical protein